MNEVTRDFYTTALYELNAAVRQNRSATLRHQDADAVLAALENAAAANLDVRSLRRALDSIRWLHDKINDPRLADEGWKLREMFRGLGEYNDIQDVLSQLESAIASVHPEEGPYR